MSNPLKTWVWRGIFAYVLIVLFAFAWAIAPASSHEWYPIRCCFQNRDCGELPAALVAPTSNGWMIRTTGEVVPYSEAEVSPDGKFHICRAPQTGKRRCFFAPSTGS